MSETFVVGDAHGNLDLVVGLLEKARADRRPGRVVVQIGDLCNCVEASVEMDLACLRAAPDLFDVLLVGNHEHPYFGGSPFWGFSWDKAVAVAVHGLSWRACLAVDGTLVSHAGLTPQFASWRTAEEAADALNDRFAALPRSAVFEAAGRARGGRSETGGILWSDWNEPKTNRFPQVVGHTPFRLVRSRGGTEGAICIDVGAKTGGTRIAGCWIRDGLVEVVVYAKEEA